MQRFESKKRFLLATLAASALALAGPTVSAQVNLSSGDVALVGWVDNGSPNDAFALLALADLPAGTTIYFTDNGWDSVSGGFRNTNGPQDGNGNETLMKLSVVTPIPAGRVLDTTQVDPAFTWTTSGAVPGATSGTFGYLVLTQSGDQICAFQHDSGQNPMNTATQLHLFVLDDTGTFEDATTTGEGNVPPGLSVAGHTAVTFAQAGSSQSFMGFDTTVLASGTKADWLAAIADPANWVFGSAGTLPTGSVTVVNLAMMPLCFGDATSLVACPCGNAGLAGYGCDNSSATGGAHLTASGAPAPDTVVLTSSGQLPSSSTFFLQGTQETANPLFFGDGLRCIGGTIRRLASTRASGGVAVFPGPGDPSITARATALGDSIQSGDARYYQVMYRDPQSAFCPNPPGNNWNVSNAMRIVW
jgi:hypothetical protein